MKFRRLLIIPFLFVMWTCDNEKEPLLFKVEVRDTDSWKMIFDLVDKKGQVFKTLDTTKYFPIDLIKDDYAHFAIFQLYDKDGLYAINSSEEILFRVHNQFIGEPVPDTLVEKKIRIEDDNKRIGFANQYGEIIIQPKFESVTPFSNGKAIIGSNCKIIQMHPDEKDCPHFENHCEEYGTINEKGEILTLGNQSFEQIKSEIGWEWPK